jgi:hypothetical protein
MENSKFNIGQVVNYSNGSLSIYTGKVVKVKEKTIIVVSSEAGLELWNAGFSVGSEITFNQVKIN